jgi:hypothetical protein
MRRKKVIGVMLSAQDDEAMRPLNANRLQLTMVDTTAQAERAGMTPELLEDLLRDES